MKKLLYGALITIAIALYAYAVYNTAWLSEDAYISYRSMDNLVHGYGLTWNTDERVQAFTNPLWVFVNLPAYLSVKLPWQVYFSGLATSAVVSLMAVAVLAFGVAESPALAFFGIVALTFCRSYVDYSTSGLENPMTHLLLALFIVYAIRGRWTTGTLFSMALCAGLSLVNRMDTALIYAPVLAYAWLAERNFRATLAMAAGLSPFIAWEVFSVVYYGFPFPNTAYAKLGNGIDSSEVLVQGFWYLLNSWDTDPLTLTLIALGLAGAPLILRNGRYTAFALGGALYLIYVVKVGGDFMQGRLLTPVLFAAVLLLVRLPVRSWALCSVAAALAIAICFRASDVPVKSGRADTERKIGEHGIADEREFWMMSTGLKFRQPNKEMPTDKYADDGRKLAARDRYQVDNFGSVGFRGYFGGTKTHIIDHYALADPLLARIPAQYAPNWRIGHFTRYVPKWYVTRESALMTALQAKSAGGRALTVDQAGEVAPVKEEVDPIAAKRAAGEPVDPDNDKDLMAYYDRLELIVRGPLWSPARWRAIVNMNLGRYNNLINGDAYRFPGLAVHPMAEVSEPKAAGTAWNAKGNLVLPKLGVEIRLDTVHHNALIEMSADHNDHYRILFRNGDAPVGQADIEPSTAGSGLQIFSITAPNSAIRAGYDAVRIVPYGGDGKSSLGHLKLL